MSPTPLERLERRGPHLLWPRRSSRLREEGARGALIAVISTIVVFGVITALVLTSAAWPAVQRQFFSWTHFKASFPVVLGGFWLDVKMFLVAEVLILVIGLAVAMGRSLRGPAFLPLRIITIAYIDLVRGLPLCSSSCSWDSASRRYSFPECPTARRSGASPRWCSPTPPTPPRCTGPASTRCTRASGSSARSIGLTQTQSLWHVLVPQAVRNVIPALLNGFVSLQKDVALVFVLGVREGLREAGIYNAHTFNYTSYVVAAVLFLLASVPVARFTDWYTDRDRRRKQAMST